MFFRRKLRNKLIKIKLIVTDVDGVLTNGSIGYCNEINGLKFFNVKDGLAVKLLKSNKISLAFISGGESEATSERAKSLNIDECHTNIEDKGLKIVEIQKRLGYSTDSTLYIGDDVNDLEVLPYVSLFIAPNDCNYKVESRADLKLRSNGGEGVLREICDILLNLKKSIKS
tara:strand:+ start:1399 stop:1911 length:513 start_codon:yes stop_codon:yes gene_type:complete